MNPVLAPGQGPVAVHRWFARGEDWAMHPWFGPHVGEMLRALDDRIKARQSGLFEIDAAGGVLVGELADDPACLDPRAAERRPCVVRLAFAAGPLSYREREGVLAALRALALPTAPGIDQRLVVAVPNVPPIYRPRPRPEAPPPKRDWNVAIALVLGAVAVAVAAWLLTRPAPEDKGKAKDPPATKAMRVEPPRASKALLELYAKVDHPYVAFLKATPEAFDRSRRSGEASYEEWLGKQEQAFPHGERPLPRRLRERVALWRELSPPMAEAAQRMRQMRKRWKGEEAPTLADEFDAFFEAAVRPEGLPPREEFDHPANVFLWRLPRDPVAAGRAFEYERDLKEALGQLAGRLGERPEPKAGLLDLLARIELGLDYEAWRDDQLKRKGTVFADADAEPGPAIEAGLRRFAGLR